MADDPSFHDKPVEWTLTAPEASRDGSAHPSPQSNALPPDRRPRPPGPSSCPATVVCHAQVRSGL
jgi:hypothetical protein